MWYEIFAVVCFCGLGIFSVSWKLIFATRCYDLMKQECSVIVRWRDFTFYTLLLIVSLICQTLLIAGLNIS